MQLIDVKQGQNLPDIALQQSGDVASLFEMAVENDISITSNLGRDERLRIPTSEARNEKVLTFYERKKVSPATIGNQHDEGIGFSAIPILIP